MKTLKPPTVPILIARKHWHSIFVVYESALNDGVPEKRLRRLILDFVIDAQVFPPRQRDTVLKNFLRYYKRWHTHGRTPGALGDHRRYNGRRCRISRSLRDRRALELRSVMQSIRAELSTPHE